MGSVPSSCINKKKNGAADLAPTSSSDEESDDNADNWTPITSDNDSSEEKDEEEGKVSDVNGISSVSFFCSLFC